MDPDRPLSRLGLLFGPSGVAATLAKLFEASDATTSLIALMVFIVVSTFYFRKWIAANISSYYLIQAGICAISLSLLAAVANVLPFGLQVQGVKSSGIVEFVPNGNDWLSSAGPYVNNARYEIWFSGVSFYVSLPKYRDKLLAKLRDGVSVRFLILDPASKYIEDAAAHFTQSPDDLRAETNITVENLRYIWTQWQDHPTSSAHFEVRVTSIPPSLRLYMFDRKEENGFMFLVPTGDGLNGAK
jgi:hypothetical protein